MKQRPTLLQQKFRSEIIAKLPTIPRDAQRNLSSLELQAESMASPAIGGHDEPLMICVSHILLHVAALCTLHHH